MDFSVMGTHLLVTSMLPVKPDSSHLSTLLMFSLPTHGWWELTSVLLGDLWVQGLGRLHLCCSPHSQAVTRF